MRAACLLKNKTVHKTGNNHWINSTDGLQHGEISNNECTACFGLFEDDLIDGKPAEECMNDECGKWMHIRCLATSDSYTYAMYARTRSTRVTLQLPQLPHVN